MLSLLLHNRQTLEAGKIIPDRLEPFIFPAGPLRDIYKTLLESKSLNECIDKIEGTEDQLSIIAQLRNSKPAETTNPETAVKMAGELLIRTVEKTYETLHQSAVTNNSYETYKKYTKGIYSLPPINIRDLIDFRIRYLKSSIDISEVEPIEKILKRFGSGSMSRGALSK